MKMPVGGQALRKKQRKEADKSDDEAQNRNT